MKRARLAGMAFVTALGALLVWPTHSRANAACGGVDVLEEMRRSEPAKYAEIMQHADATPNGEAMLWRIERDGRQPSHLFGTVHVTDARVLAIPQSVENAIAGAKTFAVEIAGLDDQTMASAMAQIGPGLIMLKGDRIDRHLNTVEVDRLRKVLAEAGVPAEAGMAFQPWLLTMMLAITDCERRRMEAGATVLDQKLEELATSHDLRPVGLETAEEQLRSTAKPSIESQIAGLKANLRLQPRLDDLMETTIRLYLSRNIAAMLPLTEVLIGDEALAAAAIGEFQQELIVNRNRRMAERALPLLAEGGAFIAVGALHLPGDAGLVALFRKAGYSVTPVE